MTFMDDRRIDFDALPRQSPMPGARFKAHSTDGKQVRILAITPEFVEPHWCTRGHSGMVLEGELEIDYQGHVARYRAGDGIVIPPGEANVHKARAL